MAAAQVSIGEAARQSEMSVDTIRYYERRALLPRLPRTPGQYRVFDRAAIERLRFIRRAQSLGFTLREIAQLTGACEGRDPDCGCVQAMLQGKLERLHQQRERMAHFERELRAMLRSCQRQSARQPCAMLPGKGRPR